MEDKDNNFYVGAGYFPDGKPVPDLLTTEEAIRYLRLDTDDLVNPEQTLRYYRNKRMLHPARIGRKNKYSKKELMRFIDEMTERTKK